MRSRNALGVIVVGLLLAAGIAGCVGGAQEGSSPSGAPEAPASSPGGAGGASGADAPPPQGRAARFDASPANRTIWANGSFSIESSLVGQFDTQTPDVDEQVTPIQDEVPAGVPFRLVAELTYASPATGQDPFRVFVRTGAHPVYAISGDEGAGRERLEATSAIVGDAPWQVVVNVDPGQDEAEIDYTLAITVALLPGTVPAEAPVAVTVPDGATGLRLTPAGGNGSLAAMVWGPDDGFVGRATADGNGSATVPVPGGGEHVVATDAPARIRVLGASGGDRTTSPTLRALGTTLAPSEAHELATQGPDTWPFEPERVPMAVAVVLQAGDAATPGATGQGFQIEVTAANGTVLRWDVAGELCQPFPCVGRADVTFSDGVLHPALPGAAFEVTVSYDASANVRVTPAGVTYVR